MNYTTETQVGERYRPIDFRSVRCVPRWQWLVNLPKTLLAKSNVIEGRFSARQPQTLALVA